MICEKHRQKKSYFLIGDTWDWNCKDCLNESEVTVKTARIDEIIKTMQQILVLRVSAKEVSDKAIEMLENLKKGG